MARAVRVAHGPPRPLSRTVGWIARRRRVRPGEAERSHATYLLRPVRPAESRRGQVLLVLRNPAGRFGAARVRAPGGTGHAGLPRGRVRGTPRGDHLDDLAGPDRRRSRR